MSSVTRRMWEVFALTVTRRTDSETGTSTLNVPKFPLASKNHKMSKEQMTGVSSPWGRERVCTRRQRLSETEAQGKNRVSLGHAAQTPSTVARHPVRFFLHYIAML